MRSGLAAKTNPPCRRSLKKRKLRRKNTKARIRQDLGIPIILIRQALTMETSTSISIHPPFLMSASGFMKKESNGQADHVK